MSTTQTEGFMKRKYEGAVRDLGSQEAELEALQEELRQAQEDAEVDIDPGVQAIDAEEESFKKRYGDLRRYSSKQLKELKDRIATLEAEVQSKSQAVVPEVPENDEEYNEWAKNYPDAARMIAVVASKESKKATHALAAQVAALEEREKKIQRQQAELELSKLHPDWSDIRDDPDFHDWVDDQPFTIQKLLNDSNDFKDVARCLDLYKFDKHRTTPQVKKTKTVDIDAADLSIRKTRPTEPRPSADKVFKESDVASMSAKKYQELEPEIMKAISEGRFVRDISG